YSEETLPERPWYRRVLRRPRLFAEAGLTVSPEACHRFDFRSQFSRVARVVRIGPFVFLRHWPVEGRQGGSGSTQGRQGRSRKWMISALVECVLVGRCCCVGSARCKEDLASKLCEFSGRPSGL